MPLDSKQYRKSFAPAQLWKFILLFAIAYIFFSTFTETINTYLVDKAISKFPQTIYADLLCLAFFIYIVTKIWHAVKYNLAPTINSILLALFILTFYFLFLRSSEAYQFYSFQTLRCLKYADWLLALSCILVLDFRVYGVALDKQNDASLIADDPDPDKIPDRIENGSYVQKIASAVNETTVKYAFAIGVFSSWGTGKTDFLLRIKKVFEASPDENIVLEFNPWKAASPESVLEDFFATLSNGLKPYNKSIAGKLKNYSKKILSTGKEVQYRLVDTVIDELIQDTTLQQRYDNINDTIRQTGKRVIILVDDLDRMPGLEVMQVLRVIRNSANFANTFFIVALDHEYIIDVLQKTGQFAKEEQYLKKIFQLTIALPQIRKKTLIEDLQNILITTDMPPEDGDKIEKAISRLKFNPTFSEIFDSPNTKEEGILESMLSNYRDVKRFCNSFKTNFSILKDDVEVTDLFVLELIKAKYFPVYQLIGDKTLLKAINNNQSLEYRLNKEGWNYLVEKSRIDQYSSEEIKSAVTFLAGESSYKNARRFSYPHNFFLYFSYQLFSQISLKDFQAAIALPAREMRHKFDQWIQNEKHVDLERILDHYDEYQSKTDFEKFLRAYLLEADLSDFSGRAKKMVMDVEKNSVSYFENKANYAVFVRSILNDNSLPAFNRAYIASELLKHSIYNKEDLILPKQELQDIIYTLFDSYLPTKKGYDDKVNSFYLFNDDKRENERIVLNSKAHERLLVFLKIPGNFEDYLKYLIRSRSIPNTDGEFVFAPFSKAIFKDWGTFKQMIQEHSFSDPKILALKPIILKGIDEYLAGKDRFQLDGQEKDFILNHLRSTGQYNYRDNY